MYMSGIADEAGAPLETQIKAHKELGWTHIEVRKCGDTSLSYATDDEFKVFHELLNQAGMQVSCFASALANWARDIADPVEEDVKELTTAIPRMQAMGAKYIRIMSYVNNKGWTDADWRHEAIRRLKELSAMAADGGVILCHENCHGWGSLSPENHNELIAEVNSPALKTVFDTGNSTNQARTSWDYYQKLDKSHIVYVHLKDMKREGHATWFGEGDSQVRKILQNLFARGYDGGLSIEPHIAAVIHKGKESDPELMYNTYLEYGRKAMVVVNEVRAG